MSYQIVSLVPLIEPLIRFQFSFFYDNLHMNIVGTFVRAMMFFDNIESIDDSTFPVIRHLFEI